ncbi:MAG: GspH/FimT family pseudopilin [Sphingomonadales bacterium]
MVKAKIKISPTSRAGATSGFTLLELLVVLLILGLVAGLTAPFLTAGNRSEKELKRTALELAAGLRLARAEAIKANRETLFMLDIGRRVYSLGSGKPNVELAAGFDLTLVAARSERVGQAGGIRFFADGSSTGGVITVSDQEEGQAQDKYRITVDWLTGRVRIGD